MNGWPVQSSRETVVTGMLITGVLVVLTALQIGLPAATREAFVFDHSEPAIWTLWTSAYVHADIPHLQKNLLGFTVGIIPVWLVFRWQKQQQALRRILLVSLAVFPVVISLSSFVVYQSILDQFIPGTEQATTKGFSGIVGVIFGLLAVAVLEIVYDRAKWPGVTHLGMLLGLVILVQIPIRAGEATLPLLSLGIVGVALSITGLARLWPPSQWVDTVADAPVPVVLVACGCLVLMMVVPGLFPLEWIQPDQVTDIFGHAAGLLLGIVTGIAFCWRSQNP